MALYDALTRPIRSLPKDPRVAAFFDLDGTLIAGFSVSSFWRDRLLSGRMSMREIRDGIAGAVGFQRGRIGFSGLMTVMARSLEGVEEKEFEELGERLFDEELGAMIYPESRALVDAHLDRGHTVAIVSSATRYQVEPIARDLGVEHVVCSELDVEGGCFTGRTRRTCFGSEKVTAAEELASSHGADLERSYAYSDSYDDLPLLRAVGRPRPTNPDRALGRYAHRHGWTARQFDSRGTPGASDWVRTGLAVGAMSTAPWLALPGALINRDAKEFLNTSLSVSCDLGTVVAGINLVVTGEQHLWSHRPAVFTFNHQSAVDAILVGKLLRRDIVAVAKRELRLPGLLGRLSEWAGTVYVDRSNREQAVAALGPVVDEIRDGRSLVIAPEGTRSPTPRLGAFKKGAFQIAMQSGVPLVPIVFRNALDAMPKHAWVVRPAKVEAVVLPPIPSTDWTPDNLNRVVAEVRGRYLEVLGQTDEGMES